MQTISIIIGITFLLYAFIIDCFSDYESHVPARAFVSVFLGIAVVLFGINSARAADFTFDPPKSDWSTPDTWREGAFQGLWLIDALQTRNIAEHPNQWREQNNYLRAHPTVGAVNRYFLVGSALHAGISYLLPEKYRAPFQYVTIGIEGGYVANNFSLGIGVGF